MVIESVSNKKVQFLRKLSDRSFRRANGLFVVEGYNILKDMPKSIIPHSIYVAQSKLDFYKDFIEKHSCEINILSDRIFNSVADTVTPQGILAVLPINITNISDKLSDRIIVLDSVSDAGNVGTIIRSAVAFGYRDIILINSADPYSGKTVRSSMGGVLKANIYETDYQEFADNVDYPVYILDMFGENIAKTDISGKVALVIGNEAHGVSDFFRNVKTKSLSIPMCGDMESLNAAISAGIAMFLLNNK